MRGITRRGFLGGAAVAAAGLPLLGRRRAAAAADPDIVDVSGSDPRAMVAAALKAFGGIGRFVKKGDHVVLKPNAGFANPSDWATTTNPLVVVAVAQACLEAKAKSVTVLEYPLAGGERCLKRCGLAAALAAVPDVKLRLLAAADDFKKVAVKGGVSLKSVEVAKAVLSADVLISLPQAKAHGQAGVSFGLKNAMGLIWDRKAFHTMLDMQQAIADLARVVKPQLTILDATRALLTNGPQGPGETAVLGRLVAGRNPVAVDAYGLTLARFNQRQMTPADAKHIEIAAAAGLGPANVAKLKVKKITA
ncbi:MAG TPA: DUF362 domain-containing protein [Polyangia bacterium]|jgi:uncharacterized protein (DUF362 family)